MSAAELILSVEDVLRPYNVFGGDPKPKAPQPDVQLGESSAWPKTHHSLPAAAPIRTWELSSISKWHWKPAPLEEPTRSVDPQLVECSKYHPLLGASVFELQQGYTSFRLPDDSHSVFTGFNMSAIVYRPSNNNNNNQLRPEIPWRFTFNGRNIEPQVQWHATEDSDARCAVVSIGDSTMPAIPRMRRADSGGRILFPAERVDSPDQPVSRMWIASASLEVEQPVPPPPPISQPLLASSRPRLPPGIWLWAPILPAVMLAVLLIAYLQHVCRRSRRRAARNEQRAHPIPEPVPEMTSGAMAVSIPRLVVNPTSPPDVLTGVSIPRPRQDPPLISPISTTTSPPPSTFGSYPPLYSALSEPDLDTPPRTPSPPPSPPPPPFHAADDLAVNELLKEISRAGYTVRSLIDVLRMRPGAGSRYTSPSRGPSSRSSRSQSSSGRSSVDMIRSDASSSSYETVIGDASDDGDASDMV